MSIGPIPQSMIKSYAADLGMIDDEASHFIGIMRLVDTEFLRMSSETAENPDHVSISDGKGVRQVMATLKARAAAKHGKP